jgi:ribonuclease HI
LPQPTATVYTDGSCHTQHRIGSWVAILFINETRIDLSGTAPDTTHNRMELTAVIKAIQYIKEHHTDVSTIHIISDSQYVTHLKDRKEKLTRNSFITKKGTDIQNADLVKELLLLAEQSTIVFTKIKAHQKDNGENTYNIEADKLSRKLARDTVNETVTSLTPLLVSPPTTLAQEQ